MFLYTTKSMVAQKYNYGKYATDCAMTSESKPV